MQTLPCGAERSLRGNEVHLRALFLAISAMILIERNGIALSQRNGATRYTGGLNRID
jgi:hypothetical protein